MGGTAVSFSEEGNKESQEEVESHGEGVDSKEEGAAGGRRMSNSKISIPFDDEINLFF